MLNINLLKKNLKMNKFLNESSMMMHDQGKMFSNEFYHGESRYVRDRLNKYNIDIAHKLC